MKDGRLTTALAMAGCLIFALLCGCESKPTQCGPEAKQAICWATLDHPTIKCYEMACYHRCDLKNCHNGLGTAWQEIKAAINIVEVPCP